MAAPGRYYTACFTEDVEGSKDRELLTVQGLYRQTWFFLLACPCCLYSFLDKS